MADNTLTWLVLLAIAVFVVWLIVDGEKRKQHEGFIQAESALTSPFINLRPQWYCAQYPKDAICQELADCQDRFEEYARMTQEPDTMQSLDYHGVNSPPGSPSQLLRESPFN